MIGRGIATAAVWCGPFGFVHGWADPCNLPGGFIGLAIAWLGIALITTAVIWQGAKS